MSAHAGSEIGQKWFLLFLKFESDLELASFPSFFIGDSYAQMQKLNFDHF